MRGKLNLVKFCHMGSGITPAYAGKTRVQDVVDNPLHFVVHALQDHPRVCGENRRRKAIRCVKPGSPPRMRGKHLVVGEKLRQTGITPAYAGKTHLVTGCTVAA